MENYSYKYVIIGGGMTADAAVRAIRESDTESSIGLISSEETPPYARPPLTKALWKGEEEVEEIDLNTSEVGLEMHLDRTIGKIDEANKIVYDDQGNGYKFEKLLIATGGSPKKIPNTENLDIIYYRTLSDYKKLHKLVDENEKFGVIGAGFIGSEIAAAIKIYKPDAQVTMIFPESGIGAFYLPKSLSDYLNKYYQEKGVKVISGDLVDTIIKKDSKYIVKTQKGKDFEFDTVIGGLGITPNVDLVKGTDIKVDNGIVVNSNLRTNLMDVFAAGDVALYYNIILNKLIRTEHEDNALSAGKIAGQNMTGQNVQYDSLPYFYSDLFDYGYEAVGILDSKLDMVESWKTPFEEGIVYYFEDDKIVGVLLWNVWEKIDDAWELVTEETTYSTDEEVKKLIEF